MTRFDGLPDAAIYLLVCSQVVGTSVANLPLGYHCVRKEEVDADVFFGVGSDV